MRWFETDSDIEAQERIPRFWKELGTSVHAGGFWADEIKSLRNDPEKRLSMALEHLPLPAAFREAAIALRAIIREKRKSQEPFERYLAWLYWLAAVSSFMIPRAVRLGEPGFNVMESIPGRVIRSLDFEYSTLGYEKLDLLNKTDRKWLVECWGEPAQHSTLNALHQNVWLEYETKLIAKRTGKEGFRDKRIRMRALPRRNKTSEIKWGWICALIIAAIVILLIYR